MQDSSRQASSAYLMDEQAPPAADGAPFGVVAADFSAQNIVVAAVEDLFFTVKIGDTAKKVGARVKFVKTDKELLAAAEENPSLIIVDLNSMGMKPLATITKIKGDKNLKKISVIGYLSHVQGELKQRAHEIGCDMVLARSAFSQNLPVILKRHGVQS